MTYKRLTCKADIILTFTTNGEVELNAEEINHAILAVEQKLNSGGFLDIKGFPGKIAMRVHITGSPIGTSTGRTSIPKSNLKEVARKSVKGDTEKLICQSLKEVMT